jgi:hypothetical protein
MGVRKKSLLKFLASRGVIDRDDLDELGRAAIEASNYPMWSSVFDALSEWDDPPIDEDELAARWGDDELFKKYHAIYEDEEESSSESSSSSESDW